jgi:hypothetical protein
MENTPSNLADRFYEKAEEVFEKAKIVRYCHLKDEASQQVHESEAGFESQTDCSGFVSYVINSVAPKHYAYLRALTRRSHPHAIIYARFLKQLPSGRPTVGWLKIDDYQALRRGDIIAWERPPRESEPGGKVNRRGHVMIVVDPPGNIRQENIAGLPVRFAEVKVLDSSGVRHFSPETLPPLAHQTARDGLGKGMIRLILDEAEHVVGYWEGPYSEVRRKPIVRPTYTQTIGFGRLWPFSTN